MSITKKRALENEEIINKPYETYKTSDIILVDDEYCSDFIFYDETEIFTRMYVETNCPFCDKDITECIGFKEDYKNRTKDNKIDLIVFFKHIRKLHSDNYIAIKNIETDVKKGIVKYTLVKKVIL